MIKSAALAQAAATPHSLHVKPSATSLAASPTHDEPKLGSQATLSLQPAAPSEPSPLVITTDRPSFSDGTGFVPVGHFQFEAGFTFSFRNHNSVEKQRHNGPEILARGPLIDHRFELLLMTSGYTWSLTDQGAGAGINSSKGFNEVSLGFKLKLKLTDQARLAASLGARRTDQARRLLRSREQPDRRTSHKLIWS